MSELAFKIISGFFTGVIFPIVLELWRAHQAHLIAAGSTAVEAAGQSVWGIIKAIWRVIVSALAAVGLVSYVAKAGVHLPGMHDGATYFVMIAVVSIAIHWWRLR